MLKEDKIELDEAVYKEGKVIKKNEHKVLAEKRIAELMLINTTGFSEFEIADVVNEIEDLQCFIKRHKWQ